MGRARLTAVVLLTILTACLPVTSQSPNQEPSGTSGGPSPSIAPTASPTAAPSSEPTLVPTPSPTLGVTTYLVMAGDTLSSIARAWGTSVQQLQAWNAEAYPSLLSDPGAVQVGWVLIVADGPDTTPLPTPAGTPMATPLATPGPTGCRAGNRVAAGSQQTFTKVSGAGRAVALTFDMGGRLEPGVEILNLLIANGVCATIFPTGAMAQTAAGQEVLAIIRAHPELFEVGNHTMHHCDLVAGGGGSPTTAPCAGVTPTADFIRDQLTDAAAIIEQFSGQSPAPYWRPPYGSVTQAVRDAAASVGYTKTFMWDIDTIDWKPISDGGPTAEQIATKVISRATDGSIVLMHLGGYETLDALSIMIPGLRDRGFLITSLSDLLN